MKQLVHRLSADADTIGELFARLVDDTKQFVRAEIEYYRLLAIGRVTGLKTAAILIVVAVFLVQASLTTLLIGVGLGIAQLFERVGMAGGVVLAAILGLLISGLLIKIAIGRIAASGEQVK